MSLYKEVPKWVNIPVQGKWERPVSPLNCCLTHDTKSKCFNIAGSRSGTTSEGLPLPTLTSLENDLRGKDVGEVTEIVKKFLEREAKEIRKRSAEDVATGYKGKRYKKEVCNVRKLPRENRLDSVTEMSLNHFIQNMVFGKIKYVSFEQIRENHMAQRIAAKLNIVRENELVKYKQYIEITIYKRIETCRNNCIRNMKIAFQRCVRLQGMLPIVMKTACFVIYVCRDYIS